MIENLDDTSNSWMDVPQNNNLTYAFLVGTPVGNLPSSGDTSFTLPGSYLAISCPVFGSSNQTDFNNYASPDSPPPNNGADCSWTNSTGGTEYQIAISVPCDTFNTPMASGTRNAWTLVWESYMYDSSGSSGSILWTQAKYDLTTTCVDANVTCAESSSGSSSASTCNLSSARRSLTPQFNRNWTVLDIASGKFDAGEVLNLLTGLFPNAQVSGGLQPALAYFTDPYHAVGSSGSLATYTAGQKVFETRLAQLLSSILYIGINSSALTGSFEPQESVLNLTGIATLKQEVVRCNLPWLGVLIVASLTIFSCALTGAYLRIITLTPDILGSISLAPLHNKTRGIDGSSTWSSGEWARSLRESKLSLGDVEPGLRSVVLL